MAESVGESDTQDVFGATVKSIHKGGKDDEYVMHAALSIVGTEVMMADDYMLMKSSTTFPAMMWLTVDDVDATYEKAKKKGFAACPTFYCPANSGEPQNMFWGDRCAGLKDPFGHVWVIGNSHKEAGDSSAMKDNEAAFMKQYL